MCTITMKEQNTTIPCKPIQTEHGVANVTWVRKSDIVNDARRYVLPNGSLFISNVSHMLHSRLCHFTSLASISIHSCVKSSELRHLFHTRLCHCTSLASTSIHSWLEAKSPATLTPTMFNFYPQC
ncbi:hypothetical protein E2C01_075335 [Portunus trituberculatus]|uniref:Ig-like domain-containing protein n=1 Tax=Portunus trituberculatus TaxID=210409 RepID=A0A5B7IGT9_PORTR|nr:hypothetical protein [Portunus trituberculatus]